MQGAPCLFSPKDTQGKITNVAHNDGFVPAVSLQIQPELRKKQPCLLSTTRIISSNKYTTAQILPLVTSEPPNRKQTKKKLPCDGCTDQSQGIVSPAAGRRFG